LQAIDKHGGGKQVSTAARAEAEIDELPVYVDSVF
jgi:hypothetical protein